MGHGFRKERSYTKSVVVVDCRKDILRTGGGKGIVT